MRIDFPSPAVHEWEPEDLLAFLDAFNARGIARLAGPGTSAAQNRHARITSSHAVMSRTAASNWSSGVAGRSRNSVTAGSHSTRPT